MFGSTKTKSAACGGAFQENKFVETEHFQWPIVAYLIGVVFVCSMAYSETIPRNVGCHFFAFWWGLARHGMQLMNVPSPIKIIAVTSLSTHLRNERVSTVEMNS